MEDSLSSRMLYRNATDFASMVTHRFVTDIENGTLDKQVFDRYLLIEGAFVETAIAIFGYATAKADDLAIRRKLIACLDALANGQMSYFERTLEDRKIAQDPLVLGDPRVLAFRDGMLHLAQEGTFAQIITGMFAAEWMYWTWCDNVRGVAFSDNTLKDWILMHASPDFAQQAKWLRDQVDTLSSKLTASEQDELIQLFGRVMRLEIAFHDAAYPTHPGR
jgi:thiaminase/transcriptional activator TenA